MELEGLSEGLLFSRRIRVPVKLAANPGRKGDSLQWSAVFEKQKSQRLHVCLVVKLLFIFHVCIIYIYIYMLYMYIYLYLYFMWPTGGGNGEVQRSATPQMRRDGLRTLRAYRFLAATHIELMTGHGGSWCLQVLHKSLSSAVLVTSVELQSKKGTTDIARTPCYNDMQVTSVKFFFPNL